MHWHQRRVVGSLLHSLSCLPPLPPSQDLGPSTSTIPPLRSIDVDVMMQREEEAAVK